MKNIRLERLNDSFQEEISKIIMTEVNDELLKFVTITEVVSSQDLSHAKVYFTALPDNKKEVILKKLNTAAPFIRKCLAPRFDTLKIPELKFIYDTTEQYSKHIEQIIEDIHKNE